MNLQNNTLIAKHLKNHNEQQILDKVYATKRKENDFSLIQIKKQRLNNEAKLQEGDRYSEINNSKIEKKEKNIQCLISNSEKKVQSNVDNNNKGKNLLLVEPNNLNIQMNFCKSVDNDLYSKQDSNVINITDTNIQFSFKSQDKYNLYKAKNCNTLVQSYSGKSFYIKNINLQIKF
jgi:hypothetical protein